MTQIWTLILEYNSDEYIIIDDVIDRIKMKKNLYFEFKKWKIKSKREVSFHFHRIYFY